MVAAGQTVYRGEIGSMLGSDLTLGHWVTQATGTGIQIDGVDMVRMHTLVLPAEGWVATKREANLQIIHQLVRHIGAVQAEVDRLRDEMLHEDILSEEAAA